MTQKTFMAVTTVALAAGLLMHPALAQQNSGVEAGTLSCNVASGWRLVFGSTRDLKCIYSAGTGSAEHYVGTINNFGVDIGYQAGGVVLWLVVAPTADIGKGALAGTYIGLTGGMAVGADASANVLIGGSQVDITATA